MPVYLFTYHAYASWLPDRNRGYVKRGRGILPQDEHMHRLYAEAMKESAVEFLEAHQLAAISILLESSPLLRFESYIIGTDATHIHALVSWRDERAPLKMRALLKGSLSRGFNDQFEQRTWLAEGASRKQVKDRDHFEYFVTSYLPKHRGWKWEATRGRFL